ncbi:indole-3-glycerol phosphate synthase [Dyadobacter jejuensis]|uniref:indole-3-glycerol-phosphate synthase n=1 Tax=Dyadobacter jejuensis TaxID=1082580 RepID=A0A316AYI7_9BACT|nr:indole-3-glycerol phosphate synthase TrpC [Dyadobacter jejuensis]PWJ55287.1 indole-3-glycerol phosphate synthase [Dyadobacter jejuensis]
MNILEKIVARKQEEIQAAKKIKSIDDLEQEPLFGRQTISLSSRLREATAPQIISEFKRKSPSKGLINGAVTPEIVTAAYIHGGAAALSVLTDSDFFGGSFQDFLSARTTNPGIPMLRKDFMVDPYQIYEAKAIGADLILLIAACLSPAHVKSMAAQAHALGLEVLLEVHNLEELQSSLCEEVDMVGVNNRNLKNFETSTETSVLLSKHIPDSFVKISESGLEHPDTILNLYAHGYKGFLIGETFMKRSDPGAAFNDLQNELTINSKLNPI